jgi:hypothetical protein
MNKELVHIDNLCDSCGFFTSNTPINGGYGCNHKECGDGEYVRNGEVINWYDARLFIAKAFTKRNIRCNRILSRKFMKKAASALNKNIIKFGIKFQGSCYTSSCPLGYIAEEKDFIMFSENSELMAEGEWLVIDKK